MIAWEVQGLAQSGMTVQTETWWPSYNPEIPLLYYASSLRQKVLNLDREGHKTPNVSAIETVSRKKCQALI